MTIIWNNAYLSISPPPPLYVNPRCPVFIPPLPFPACLPHSLHPLPSLPPSLPPFLPSFLPSLPPSLPSFLPSHAPPTPSPLSPYLTPLNHLSCIFSRYHDNYTTIIACIIFLCHRFVAERDCLQPACVNTILVTDENERFLWTFPSLLFVQHKQTAPRSGRWWMVSLYNFGWSWSQEWVCPVGGRPELSTLSKA